MKKKNSLFENRENCFESLVASRAEARRIGWHLENLRVVRIGRFQNNFDELVSARNEANVPSGPA